MRVSREKAEENRRTVIETAGRLFRAHGFDGIGLNDLMGAAGLTQGGFYKQFKSKEDLAVQACDRVLTDSAERLACLVEGDDDPLATIVTRYLSPAHREEIGDGCIFAALGGDAVRHSPALIRSFEKGIHSYLGILDRAMLVSLADDGVPDDPVVVLSTMVGALLLSRLVEDEALSDRILGATINCLLDRHDGAEARSTMADGVRPS